MFRALRGKPVVQVWSHVFLKLFDKKGEAPAAYVRERSALMPATVVFFGFSFTAICV